VPDVESANLGVPVELESAGPYVRGVSSALSGELTTLQGRLDPIAATWTGDTYNDFNNFEAMWHNSAINLFGDGADNPGILGVIAKALDIAWINYQNTEHGNSKMFLG
jgi:hypothetical protein